MGLMGWANAQQRAVLERFRGDYEKCRATKKYKDFWRTLFEAYNSEFPLIEEAFPGKTLDDLSSEEEERYTKLLAKRHSVGRISFVRLAIINCWVFVTEAEGMVSLAI